MEESAQRYHVQIVPEIDVPAHALSFAKVFPEHMVAGKTSPLQKGRPLTDHLDISRPETTEFVKRIIQEGNTRFSVRRQRYISERTNSFRITAPTAGLSTNSCRISKRPILFGSGAD